MLSQKFYVCRHCGNMISFIKSSSVPVVCCGENMAEIIPNTTDAAVEKHVPVIDVNENTVTVTIGSVNHPMTDEHSIEWVSLECRKGNQRKDLSPGNEPKAVFSLTNDDSPIAAYAYCNLHGLWKKEI